MGNVMMNTNAITAVSAKKFPHSALFLLLTFSSLWIDQCHGNTAESWNNTGSGNWNDNQNWNKSDFPNEKSKIVNLGGSITKPSTVTLGQDIALGHLTISSLSPYTISGSGVNKLIFQSDIGHLSISVN